MTAGTAWLAAGTAPTNNTPPRSPDRPPERKRWSWFRREAIDLGDVVVQVFSVVVGILLALFINNRVTERQQQSAVNEAMRAIKAELSANRAQLRAHAKQMFDEAKAMQDAPANRNQPPRACFEWQHWNGIGGLNLTDAAYQTAIATQALANMPFREAQLVAQVYGWQHYFQKGVDLDVGILTGSARPLYLCVGFVEEMGRSNLQLDSIYSKLIGPDTAALPTPPSPAPGASTSVPSSGKPRGHRR